MIEEIQDATTHQIAGDLRWMTLRMLRRIFAFGSVQISVEMIDEKLGSLLRATKIREKIEGMIGSGRD